LISKLLQSLELSYVDTVRQLPVKDAYCYSKWKILGPSPTTQVYKVGFKS